MSSQSRELTEGQTTFPQDYVPPGLPILMAKHKMKTKTKLMPAENPLGSLGLTAREGEVLNWIAQGKTNYEIGVILSACTGTICKHVERILCKLRVKNRTSAAAIAFAALAKGKRVSSSMTRTHGSALPQLTSW